MITYGHPDQLIRIRTEAGEWNCALTSWESGIEIARHSSYLQKTFYRMVDTGWSGGIMNSKLDFKSGVSHSKPSLGDTWCSIVVES